MLSLIYKKKNMKQQKKLTKKDKEKYIKDRICWKCGKEIIIEKKKVTCSHCFLEFIMR